MGPPCWGDRQDWPVGLNRCAVWPSAEAWVRYRWQLIPFEIAKETPHDTPPPIWERRICRSGNRAVLTACYAAGLRASEAVILHPRDIDSEHMGIRVEQGKGAKDRYRMISERLMEVLRDDWRRTRPDGKSCQRQFLTVPEARKYYAGNRDEVLQLLQTPD